MQLVSPSSSSSSSSLFEGKFNFVSFSISTKFGEKKSSNCALGTTRSNPILTTLLLSIRVPYLTSSRKAPKAITVRKTSNYSSSSLFIERKSWGTKQKQKKKKMAPNMKFWDDWADVEDMDAMWNHPDVCKEWLAAGEERGQKVHMSRNFDGKPYVTHTEMRAMAEILTSRYFKRLDVAMICAIAEIESSRQPLAYRYEKKLQEASTGLMQTLQSTAEWLSKDMGYHAYTIDAVSPLLYRPFVSVYFGAAYLKWLSTYDGKKRNEEFVVRGYNGGPRGATEKSTLGYWNKYLIAKQNLPTTERDTPLIFVTPVTTTPRPISPGPPPPQPVATTQKAPSTTILRNVVTPSTSNTGITPVKEWTYWDEQVSKEDLDEMWRHPEVKKEWTQSNEKKGQVRFARDAKFQPYLTTTELKAVAEITVARHFADRGVSSVMLRNIAEVSSKRRLYGADRKSGIMQTSYPTVVWLYKDMGYKKCKLRSPEDLWSPFVAMYFGAAYVCWLSTYQGRARTDEFVVKAYHGGPNGVDDPAAICFWHRYQDCAQMSSRPAQTQLQRSSEWQMGLFVMALSFGVQLSVSFILMGLLLKSVSTGGGQWAALWRRADGNQRTSPSTSVWRRIWASG